MSDWIARYAQSHHNSINRFCHTIGIPLIALSVVGFVASPFVHGLWKLALGRVRGGLDLSVRRARLRGEAARVLPRLALSPGGTPMVGREDQRKSLI
jgi:hypothetical protein